MPRTLSDAALASIAGETTDEVWLVLLIIDHDDLEAPIRVVNNFESIVSAGETFVGLPFDISLPGESPDAPTEAKLSVDNVDREIITTLRAISSPPTVTIQVVLASQPDTIELQISNLTLRDVSGDGAKVQGSLRFESITVEPVAEMITPQRFPGLF